MQYSINSKYVYMSINHKLVCVYVYIINKLVVVVVVVVVVYFLDMSCIVIVSMELVTNNDNNYK